MRRPLEKAVKVCIYAVICLAFVSGAALPSFTYAEEKPAKTKGEKILVNFVDVDIPTVANFISKLTGKNFIYDERVTGKVTIIAPSKIDVDEAFDLFVSVLDLKGYSTVFTGTAYKIVPTANIKQGPVEVARPSKVFRVNETYIARLIPLSYIRTQDIMPTLQPLVSREGFISAFGKGNSLLVIDNALNIEKILNIVKLLDAEPLKTPPELIFIKNAQAETVALILKQIKSGSRRMDSPPQSVQDVTGPIPDKRLNALILYGTPEENEEYKRLIETLDARPPEVSSKINVYYLENADATEMAKVLEALTRQSPGPSAPGAPGMPFTPVTSELTGRIVITPDKATNSLIILASPEDYQNIVQVVKKLDRRPRQVFVEAMITEVSIDKTLELGTKWRATAKKDGKPVLIGGVGSVDNATIQNVLTGLAGLTAGGLANFITVPVTRPDGTSFNLTAPGFAALFSLSEFRNVIDVLSTPHILTNDNKEAEIVVGENVPFLSKFEREGATVSQPLLQSIERKDVGIMLRIKPQISEGDYIRLDIYQEISAIEPRPAGVSDIVTTKRSAKTSVVVKDRQTVVIGGLIQDKETKNVAKVPLLGDIPILGWLFKRTTTERSKTNLLLYLTPTIVKDFENLDELKKRKSEEFEKKSTFEESIKTEQFKGDAPKEEPQKN